MTKAQVILVAVFLFSASFSQARTIEQDNAVKILKAAAKNSKGHKSAIFSRMAQTLDRTALAMAPNGRNFSQCRPNVLSFMAHGSPYRIIYVCQHLIAQPSIVISQTLIHETAHLIGYTNDCDATRLEIEAMVKSGEPQYYENLYVERCGLKQRRK